MARKAMGAPSAAERAASRWLASHCQEHVDLARRDLAIACRVALDIRCLDIFERKVSAFLITQFGHPFEESSIERRLAGLSAYETNP
jgi:hypothetical protein